MHNQLTLLFYTTITDMPWNANKGQLNEGTCQMMYAMLKLTWKILDTETITLYSLQMTKHQDTATVTQGLIYQVKYYRMQVT
jgi:hypothetical protein